MVVILMGVAGSGKSTVAHALAAHLGWRFVEADNYHSTANKDKMHHGVPLTDADRAGWLAALRAVVARAIDRREPMVLACSALKQRYRDVLRGGRSIRFVYLRASEGALRSRLESRHDHFAGVSLLPSQLATLEEPVGEADAITIDATLPAEQIVSTIRRECGI